MSDYIAERIEKPKSFQIAPLKSGRGKRETFVIGFDSEADTRTGRPMLLQFAMPHQTEDEVWTIEVPENEENAAMRIFLQLVGEYCTRKDTEYLIYGWNLAYEFTQLLHDIDTEAKTFGEFSMDIVDRATKTRPFNLRVFNDKRHLMTITHLGTKRQIRLLDGMSYFKTSLDNAAKMLGIGEKYKSISALAICTRCGQPDPITDRFCRRCTTRDDLTDADFLRYSRMDAFITRGIGEYIRRMHDEYDVSTCISAPHFASKVFKRRYLRRRIEPVETNLEQAGLWSYHGGKNGFYLPGPALIEDCYQYDITSAYPEAMRQLPNIETANWVPVDDWKPGRHAIYRVTLAYRRCAYRGMQSFDGKWPESGTHEVYVTSYELDAMLANGECDIIKIAGWRMLGLPGGPLMEYVDEFFDLKARSEGPVRETAKLFLNSLYGKFFQKVALGRVGWLNLGNIYDPEDTTAEWITTDPDVVFDWRAGGLYHPPIASLITGYVRARIHHLEHKYESLMTSTDGIFGMVEPDSSDLGKHLGGLTVKRGALRIWRERLYAFRPHDGSEPKWAAHGFRAGLSELERIPLARGTYEYIGRQMVTLKLSNIGLNGERYEPGRFVDLPFSVAI